MVIKLIKRESGPTLRTKVYPSKKSFGIYNNPDYVYLSIMNKGNIEFSMKIEESNKFWIAFDDGWDKNYTLFIEYTTYIEGKLVNGLIKECKCLLSWRDHDCLGLGHKLMSSVHGEMSTSLNEQKPRIKSILTCIKNWIRKTHVKFSKEEQEGLNKLFPLLEALASYP